MFDLLDRTPQLGEYRKVDCCDICMPIILSVSFDKFDFNAKKQMRRDEKTTKNFFFSLVEKKIRERMVTGATDDTDSFIHEVMKVDLFM